MNIEGKTKLELNNIIWVIYIISNEVILEFRKFVSRMFDGVN